MDQLAIESAHEAERRAAQAQRIGGDGLEDRLHVGRRATDHMQDLARRRLLLQRLSQAHLKVADPSRVGLGRLPGGGPLAFDLRLRGLGTPTHPCLLEGSESGGDRR
jgi:hypothetical protein